jgi:hypothetical protein
MQAPRAELVREPVRAAVAKVAPPEPRVRLWTFGGIEGWLAARDGDVLVSMMGRDEWTRELVVDDHGARDTRRDLLDAAALSGFSERARDYLLACGVRRDPVDVPRGDELAEMLARWGLRGYPALEAANAEWSGLAWGAEPPTLLGTFASLFSFFPEPIEQAAPRPPGLASLGG